MHTTNGKNHYTWANKKLQLLQNTLFWSVNQIHHHKSRQWRKKSLIMNRLSDKPKYNHEGNWNKQDLKKYTTRYLRKKASGYNLETGNILKESILMITQIYSTTLRTEYFPCQLKVGQLIMIGKPALYNILSSN